MENEYRNVNRLMKHKFNIADAVLVGMEAAVIIHDLRFWLDLEKYRSVHDYNGEEYYWIESSHEEFAKKFPYIKKRKIGNILRKLEKDGIIFSANFEQDYGNYRIVKYYTIPSLYQLT